MSGIAHMDMLYHKEFESMNDYPFTFDWWMVEKRAEAEAAIASLQAEAEEARAQMEALREKVHEAFWEGHTRGRIWGQEGITREHVKECVRWVNALLSKEGKP